MTIYGRFGDKLTIVRHAVLSDVERLTARPPDLQDRNAIEQGFYVVIAYAADGQEDLYSMAFLRAEGGLREIEEAIEATVPKGLTIFEGSRVWKPYEIAMIGLDPKAELDVFQLGLSLRARGYRITRAERIGDELTATVARLGIPL